VGEVKTEVEYLFDLLTTESYLDKEIGCKRRLRLCVFIDDLDRCPKELVVSVLEAVILLLVDGPISVWMAVDSRIVVQCIEAVKLGLFDKANISGQEFLDKIVQLPFALPELTNDTKESYLDKIVNENELDPARIVSRFLSSGLDKKLGIGSLKNKDKDPFCTLTQIATALNSGRHINSRRERKAAIGMTESELIKIVAKNPQHASAEHREILCSIISETISQLILERGKSGEQITRETDSEGSSHITQTHASDDIVHFIDPPPSGLYIPMLNDNERRCLKDFIPFIDGNPRRMKRIINVFNVTRRIAELRCEASSPNIPQLTPKILKIVILLEQWPYRMAWLLQLIENVKKMSSSCDEGSMMNRFLEDYFSHVLPVTGKSWWEKICSVDIVEVYRRIVCELLSISNIDSSNLGTVDSDPQLFEGLLLVSTEGLCAITVDDLKPLGCIDGGEYETCLRSYMFNMPQAITDKVSILMNKALANYVGNNGDSKLYLAERFKRMSDALSSRVQAARHCPEFKCFLTSDERSELEDRALL
jgi:hypothetical protein